MAIRKNLKGLANRLLGRSSHDNSAPSPSAEKQRQTATAPARELVLETEDAEDDSVDVEVDSALVADWINEGRDLLFVDIREVVEMQRGHVDGAHLLPMSEIQERVDELPSGRDLIVYCAAGARSYGVAHYLREQGRLSFSLVGGMGSWLALGGEQVVPPRDSPFRPVDLVRLTDAAAARLGRGATSGTIQEIRQTDGGPRFSIYASGELLSELAAEDLELA
jgi:rhodanese-related sulfurtransferase